MIARAVLAALAALVVALPAGAGAATPRTTLPDVEDEVMCVECGTVLNISNSAVADDQREFIQDRIDRGATKAEIKRDLVDEFGPDVLAMPDGRGFNAAVYVIPAVLGLLGLLGVALAARRWRSARRVEPGQPGDDPALDPADEQRLSAELAAFDR
jgi:cytochrome c-type biogenesis protein CcmH